MHEQQQHEFRDGTRITMMGDSILVRPDAPRDRTTSGLIHYPGGAMEHVLNTGEILAFGTRDLKDGRRIPIPDLETGKKCVFVRFIAEQDTNKALRERFPDECIRLKTSDILCIYAAEDEEHVL